MSNKIVLALSVIPFVLVAAPGPQMGVLTPPVRDVPRINGPRVFGVRPGHPVLWRMPITGLKPMNVEVSGLPDGVSFDPETRMLIGTVDEKGVYDFTVTASNQKGKSERKMTLRVGNVICLTPPLGWNSWNCWGWQITDEKMRRAADAMVSSGLADHGWTYIVVDDCWRTRPTVEKAGFPLPDWIPDYEYMYGQDRADDGTPLTNPKFPDMKAMADYIHSKGLKAGLYSVPCKTSCCYTHGSYGNEAKDASTWAEWGYDLVKYDWCYGDREYAHIEGRRERQVVAYRLMGELLAGQDRDIVYNVCNYGRFDVVKWARDVGGQYWRTNDDVQDEWPKVLKAIDCNLNVAGVASPGGWNDPDMLVIGAMRMNKFTKCRLTPNEQYTHMSLWMIMSAPLFIGCDMERLDPLALSFLTNDEALDINQDELGCVGRPIVHGEEFDVWARPLVDGSWAFALFNRTEEPSRISVEFSAFGGKSFRIRDVWAQRDIGSFSDGFSAEVYGHATRLFRAYPVNATLANR